MNHLEANSTPQNGSASTEQIKHEITRVPETQKQPTLAELAQAGQAWEPLLILGWLFSESPTIYGPILPPQWPNSSLISKEMVACLGKELPKLAEKPGSAPDLDFNYYSASGFDADEFTELAQKTWGPDFPEKVVATVQHLNQFQNEVAETVIKQDMLLAKILTFFKGLNMYATQSRLTEKPLSYTEATRQAETHMATMYGFNWRNNDHDYQLMRLFNRKTQQFVAMSTKPKIEAQIGQFEQIKQELLKVAGGLLALGYKQKAMAGFDLSGGYFSKKDNGELHRLTKDEFEALRLTVIHGAYGNPMKFFDSSDQEINVVGISAFDDQGQPIYEQLTGNITELNWIDEMTLIKTPFKSSADLHAKEHLLIRRDILNQLDQLYSQFKEDQNFADLNHTVHDIFPTGYYPWSITRLNFMNTFPDLLRQLQGNPKNLADLIYWVFSVRGVDYYVNREIQAKLARQPEMLAVIQKSRIDRGKNSENIPPLFQTLQHVFDGLSDQIDALAPARAASSNDLESRHPNVTNQSREEIERKETQIVFTVHGPLKTLRAMNRLVHKNEHSNHHSWHKAEPNPNIQSSLSLESGPLLLDQTSYSLTLPIPEFSEIVSTNVWVEIAKGRHISKIQLQPDQYGIEISDRGNSRIVILDPRLRQGKLGFLYEVKAATANPELPINQKGLRITTQEINSLTTELRQKSLIALAEAIETSLSKHADTVDIVEVVEVIMKVSNYSYDGKSVSRSQPIFNQLNSLYNLNTKKYNLQCDGSAWLLASCLKHIFQKHPQVRISEETCFQTNPKHITPGSSQATLFVTLAELHAQVNVQVGNKTWRYDATAAEPETNNFPAIPQRATDENQLYIPVASERSANNSQIEINHLKANFSDFLKKYQKLLLRQPKVGPLQSFSTLIGQWEDSVNNSVNISKIKTELATVKKSLDVLNWLNYRMTSKTLPDGSYPNHDYIQVCTKWRSIAKYYQDPQFVRELGYLIDTMEIVL